MEYVRDYLGYAKGLVYVDRDLALLEKDAARKDIRDTTKTVAIGCLENLPKFHGTFDLRRLSPDGKSAQDFSGEESSRRWQILEDISALSRLLVDMAASIESRSRALNWTLGPLSACCEGQDLAMVPSPSPASQSRLSKQDGSEVSGHESSRRSGAPSGSRRSRWLKGFNSFGGFLGSGRSKVPRSTVQTDVVAERIRLSTSSIPTAHREAQQTIASNPSSILTSPWSAEIRTEAYPRCHDAEQPRASRSIVIKPQGDPQALESRPKKKRSRDSQPAPHPGPPPTRPLPQPPSKNSSVSQSRSKSSKWPAPVDLSLCYGPPTTPPPTRPLPVIPDGRRKPQSIVTATLSSIPSPSRSFNSYAGSESTVSLSDFPVATASAASADSPSFSLADWQ